MAVSDVGYVKMVYIRYTPNKPLIRVEVGIVSRFVSYRSE